MGDVGESEVWWLGLQYRGALPTELVFRGNSRARESISIPITGTPVVLTRQVSPTVIGLWRTMVYSEG